ncbi:COG4223 family protein [Paracoccus benzoatiresistens]|uniref:Inner membrane protein n=1 Tax=Paracoccus benzoatiresistens TaxID=2997341 RepID=A0ABT4IZT8_9RHOB|nr:hypothetical protein [Paracoccus sp. EF6]MCZ0960381.1 hypothetical protein [Paracoccus sp. EF6]
MLKKEAAEPGVIAQAETGPGDGTAAMPTGGEIKPIESSLLGDGTGQNPAAERKAARGKSEAKPKEAPKEAPKDLPKDVLKDVPKETPKDVPAQAALSDTPVPASTAAPAQKVTVRKTGFWPVFLGGVVAAGLGSAATIWALPHLPAGWLPVEPVAQPAAQPAEAPAEAPQVDVAAIRAEAVSAAEAAAAERIDALRAELAAQPQATPAQDTPPGPSAEDLAALRQQIEEQTAQIQELTARPQIDPDLAARVQTLADQAGTLEQQIQTAAQAAQAQINAAQAEAQQLQEAAAETTRRAEAVAAVASLQTALDRGVTPDEARQTLEGAGLEAPEALAREVPSLDSLQTSFPEAARAALRASFREESAAGNGNLLTNFLRAQTGARSVEAREGDDPDAILSRANEAVEAGRIADAVTEIEALPDDAKAAPAMAEWLAGATAYRDARAALSDLSTPSN